MDNIPEETPKTSSDKTKYIVIGVIVIAAFATIYMIFNKTANAAATVPNSIFDGISAVYSDLKTGVKAAFVPINKSQTLYTVKGDIEEEWLAVTASREIEIKYQYSTSWMGSDKTIEMVATYKVLAGVDLAEVEYNFQGNNVLVNKADGIIIACERLELHELNESDGWWNEVGDEDRKRAQNALDEKARKQAKSSDLLKEATNNFIKKVQVGSGAPEEEFKFMVAKGYE